MSQPWTDLLVCSGGDGGTLLVESGDIRCGWTQIWGGHQHAPNLVSWLVVVEQQRTREGSYVVYTLVTCPKDTPQVEFEHTHPNCTLGRLQLWKKVALNTDHLVTDRTTHLGSGGWMLMQLMLATLQKIIRE